MKQKDILFIKNYLDNDFILRDYVSIKKTSDHNLKIFYSDKIVTICDGVGFAYLIGWWVEGNLLGTQADHLSKLCRTYNDRF